MAKNNSKKTEMMEEDIITNEELLKEVEKIKGKIELLEGTREELNDRIASISEEVGDLRRMILDREQSQRELEVNFEKVRDAVEQIEPLKIAKEMEKLSAEIEKTSARVEINEQLFRNFDEEIKKVREVLSRFKSFENLVDLEKRINEKVSRIEKAERYTERMASKAEGIFADLNEKLLALKDKLDTIKKVDDLTKDLVKEVDQLSLKLEKDVAKTEDLDKLKQSLEKKIEKKTDLLEAKIESRINEIVNEIPAHEDYNVEDIKNRIKELAASIKDLERKNIHQKSELEDVMKRVESVLKMFKSPEELLDEREKIINLMKKVESDYRSGSLKRESYKEIIEANKKRLEAIDAILERINQEAIYKKVKYLERILNTLLEKSEEHISKSVFNDTVKKLFKELDTLSERCNKVGGLGKNVKRALEFSKLSSERLDLLEKRLQKLQEKLVKFSEIESSINNIREKLEENRKVIEKVKKDSEKKTESKEITELSKKIAEIFNRIASIEKKQDELIEYKERINPSDITKLLSAFAELENEVESLKEEKADANDLLQIKKSFEDVVKRNVEIIEKLLEEEK